VKYAKCQYVLIDVMIVIDHRSENVEGNSYFKFKYFSIIHIFFIIKFIVEVIFEFIFF